MRRMHVGKNARRVFLTLTFIVPALSFAAGALDDAERALLEGKDQDALTLVNATLANNPADIDALFIKSTALIHLNKITEASTTLEKLVQLKPDSPEAYNNLATIYAKQGQHKKAAELLDKALTTDPRYATIYQNLTKIYAKLAGMAYRRALESEQPTDSDAISLDMIANLPAAPVEPAKVVAAVTPIIQQPVATAAAPVAAINAIPAKNPSTPDDAIKSVLAWAKAWSEQDVDAYLSHYSDDFKTPDNLSFKDWSDQRRERLKSPRFIRVQIKQPEAVLLENGSIANISFYQDYASNTFNETVKKILILKWVSGKWLILLEQVGV